jgi:adenine deaminase
VPAVFEEVVREAGVIFAVDEPHAIVDVMTIEAAQASV